MDPAVRAAAERLLGKAPSLNTIENGRITADYPDVAIVARYALERDHEATRSIERYRSLVDELAASTGASAGAGEATRLRERLRIATNALGAIADQGGPSWKLADDALVQMAAVDQSSGG